MPDRHLLFTEQYPWLFFLNVLFIYKISIRIDCLCWKNNKLSGAINSLAFYLCPSHLINVCIYEFWWDALTLIFLCLYILCIHTKRQLIVLDILQLKHITHTILMKIKTKSLLSDLNFFLQIDFLNEKNPANCWQHPGQKDASLFQIHPSYRHTF